MDFDAVLGTSPRTPATTRAEELRALALEIQNRYDLMLKLDLDPEDADLHRELLELASRNRAGLPPAYRAHPVLPRRAGRMHH
jgi:hypothetical protein